MTIQDLLNAIHSKEITKSAAAEKFIALGYEAMKVDINNAPFDINYRYLIQEVFIAENKRGNLAKYAGKNCEVIVTNISGNGGARVNFYIKAV